MMLSHFDLLGTKPSPGGKVPRPSLRGIKGRMRDGDILPDCRTNGFAFPGTISTVAGNDCTIGGGNEGKYYGTMRFS